MNLNKLSTFHSLGVQNKELNTSFSYKMGESIYKPIISKLYKDEIILHDYHTLNIWIHRVPILLIRIKITSVTFLKKFKFKPSFPRPASNSYSNKVIKERSYHSCLSTSHSILRLLLTAIYKWRKSTFLFCVGC